jgi:hypothetical protein
VIRIFGRICDVTRSLGRKRQSHEGMEQVLFNFF